MTAPTQSLLDLDLGFLALPRRLCASTFFTSLRADERMVFVTLILRAQYRPGEFWFAGKRFSLEPGQLMDSEEVLAKLSGSTRKTVRTVLRKANEANLISRVKVHPSGQCPWITTIRDYARIQYASGERANRWANDRHKDGPVDGPANGPHKNKENREPPNIQPRASTAEEKQLSEWLKREVGQERWTALEARVAIRDNKVYIGADSYISNAYLRTNFAWLTPERVAEIIGRPHGVEFVSGDEYRAIGGAA